MVVVIGFIVGAVVTGIAWAVDYSKRNERYENDRQQRAATHNQNQANINGLRDVTDTHTHQLQRGRVVHQENTREISKLKAQDVRNRKLAEERRNRRDELERDNNEREINNVFNRLGF